MSWRQIKKEENMNKEVKAQVIEEIKKYSEYEETHLHGCFFF